MFEPAQVLTRYEKKEQNLNEIRRRLFAAVEFLGGQLLKII